MYPIPFPVLDELDAIVRRAEAHVSEEIAVMVNRAAARAAEELMNGVLVRVAET